MADFAVEDYEDIRSQLIRIRNEVNTITDYMYAYESHDDTENTPASERVSYLTNKIDDELGELFAMACNVGG